MEAFWDKGYEGASLSDLTSAMGMDAPSLYAAFGSKAADGCSQQVSRVNCHSILPFTQPLRRRRPGAGGNVTRRGPDFSSASNNRRAASSTSFRHIRRQGLRI